MSSSGGSGGAAFRLSILLLILVAVAGLFAYDHFVTMPNITKKIQDFENLTLGALQRPKMSPEELEKFNNMTEEEQEAYEKQIKLEDAIKAAKEREMNTPGLTKENVRQKLGLKPIEVKQIGEYEVEHYRLSRTLPFMPGGAEIFSVYRKDRYLGYEPKMPTQKDLDKRFNLTDGTDKKPDMDNLPTASAGG